MIKFLSKPILVVVVVIFFAGLTSYLGRQVFLTLRSPRLDILEPQQLFQSDGLVVVVGKTDPGALVTIDGAAVAVDERGNFRQLVALDPGRVARLHVQAIDRFGKESERDIVVVSDVLRFDELVLGGNVNNN